METYIAMTAYEVLDVLNLLEGSLGKINNKGISPGMTLLRKAQFLS